MLMRLFVPVAQAMVLNVPLGERSGVLRPRERRHWTPNLHRKLSASSFGADYSGIHIARFRGACPVSFIIYGTFNPPAILIMHYYASLAHYSCKGAGLKESVLTYTVLPSPVI
jgi:hypothetical protein